MTIEMWIRWCAICLAGVSCGGEDELPPVVAGSAYIAYHADADVSVICMDDLLAREDAFIERTAALLGVEPPSNIIDYVWDPVKDRSDSWACSGSVDSCYTYKEGSDVGVVVSNVLTKHHELVHAIEVQALGGGHPVLQEGIAEYLGTLNQTSIAPGAFPALFKAMVGSKLETTMDYDLAMHFVGSLVSRFGAAKYLALRERMPANAGLEKFAEVFEAEVGRPFDAVLEEMDGEMVRGNDLFDGCGEDEAPEIAWTNEGEIDTLIESSCGDPWFHGGGFSDGLAGFYGRYVVDVSKAGYYDLTVSGVEGGPDPLRALLTGCSFAMSGTGIGSFAGMKGNGLLQAGRYSLGIAFPQRSEAIGRAMIQLVYVAPVP